MNLVELHVNNHCLLVLTVRTASREAKLTFIPCFGSNRNAFCLYTVTSVACSTPFVMHMRDYTRGVATVRIYPYPALLMTLNIISFSLLWQMLAFKSYQSKTL